jgi:tetratricopeptide (TPR) repeat protein
VLFISLVAVTVLGVVKFYRFQVRRHAEAFLRSGISAAQNHHKQQWSDAVQQLTGATALAPDLLQAYVALAGVLRQTGSLTNADACIERMLVANPDSAAAKVCAGRYFLETGRSAAAEPHVAAALALAPNDRDVLLLAVDYSLLQGNLESARSCVRRLQDLDPADSAAWGRLADLDTRLGNRGTAIEALRRGVQADPKDERLLSALVDQLCGEEQADAADTVLQQVAHDQPNQDLMKLLHARIAHARGKWAQAAGELEQLEFPPNTRRELLRQRQFWLGDCYGRIGDLPRQFECWRQALAVDPSCQPLRHELIEALAACGRIDEAVDEARQMKTVSRTTAQDDRQLAHLLVMQAQLRAPSPRRWTDVEKLLDASAPGDSDRFTLLLRAELRLAQNRPQEAQSLLRAAAEQFPRELEYRLALAGVAWRQDDPAEASVQLEQAAKQTGDSPRLRLAQAAYFLWRQGAGAAPHLRNLFDDISTWAAPDQLALAWGLAWASCRTGDYEFCTRLCGQLASDHHADPAFWLLQFELALRSGGIGTLPALLNQIQQAEGRGPHWEYGQAVHFTLLAKEGQPRFRLAAREHLARAQQLAPSWSCVPLLLADLDAAERPESAAMNYVRAVTQGEARVEVIRRVLEYLDGCQRYREIHQVMQQLGRRGSPLLLASTGGGTQIALPLDDFTTARRTFRRMADGSPRAAEQLWIARVDEVLAMQSEVDGQAEQAPRQRRRAEQDLQQALTLDPADASVRMAAVQFYLRCQQPDQARRALQDAAETLPPARRTAVLGEGWELLGDGAEAEKCWRETLRSAGNNAPRDRAAEFFIRTGGDPRLRGELEAALAAQPPPDLPGAIWLRHRLAWQLTAQGNEEDRQRALQLVVENVNQPNASVQDRSLAAMLMAASNNHAWRQTAIGLLEGLTAGRCQAAPEETFFLARLYLLENNLPRARANLNELVTHFPIEPRYLSLLIQVLARENALAEAETQFSRLEALAPGQFVTVAAQAEMLLAHQQAADILPLVEGCLKRSDRPPRGAAADLDQAAMFLEGMGPRLRQTGQSDTATVLAEAATAIRSRLVAQYPKTAVQMVLQLAQMGRYDEALTWIEKAAPQLPTDPLADVLSRLLVSAPTPAQREPIEKILSASLKKRDRPASLLATAALWHCWQQHYDQSETLLRESLQKQPAHVPALNNLALELALQKKQLDEALTLIEKAIELAGANPSLLDTRALVYLARGDTKQALADVDRAIVQAPQAVSYFHKARILLAENQSGAAHDAETRARELGLRFDLLHPLDRAALDPH